MLESLACGTPVAAFLVLGPVDVIGESGAGILHENLSVACIRALDIPREKAPHYAKQFSWERSIDRFVRNLTPQRLLDEVHRRERRTVSGHARFRVRLAELHMGYAFIQA